MSIASTTNTGNGARHGVAVRWAGVIVTLVLAAGAMTVQWGVVTARLQHMEKRLDELIIAARALRREYQAVERRISYIESRLNGPLSEREGP